MGGMNQRRTGHALGLGLLGLALTQCGPGGGADTTGSGGSSLGGADARAGGASTGGGAASGGASSSGGAPAGGSSATGGATGGLGGDSGWAGGGAGGGGDSGSGGSAPLLELGESCQSATDCESHHCADGVCCDTACDGACVACADEKTGEANGACAPIPLEEDPDEECAADTLTCQAGFCDGAGSCAAEADGTVCRTAAGFCDAEEACSGGVCPSDSFVTSAPECTPYVCSGSSASCTVSCLTSADCASDARAVCLGDACVLGKLVFVSSETYTGNLGGVSGAHQKCQALAQAAGLSGTYLAWINGSTGDILDSHEQSTLPYVRIGDQALIANHWSALTSGTLANPINRTETGAVVGNEYAWTNSTPQGGTKTSHCSDWTSTSGNGSAGLVPSALSQWTDAGTMPCNFGIYRLYCFEQ